MFNQETAGGCQTRVRFRIKSFLNIAALTREAADDSRGMCGVRANAAIAARLPSSVGPWIRLGCVVLSVDLAGPCIWQRRPPRLDVPGQRSTCRVNAVCSATLRAASTQCVWRHRSRCGVNAVRGGSTQYTPRQRSTFGDVTCGVNAVRVATSDVSAVASRSFAQSPGY
jgi:hypothetical protein